MMEKHNELYIPNVNKPHMVSHTGELISNFAKTLWGENIFSKLWGEKPGWGDLEKPYLHSF